MSGWKENSAGSLSPMLKEVRIKARHEGKEVVDVDVSNQKEKLQERDKPKIRCFFFFFFLLLFLLLSFFSILSSLPYWKRDPGVLPAALLGVVRPSQFLSEIFSGSDVWILCVWGKPKKSTNHFELEEGHDYNHNICQASPLRVAREELRLSI